MRNHVLSAKSGNQTNSIPITPEVCNSNLPSLIVLNDMASFLTHFLSLPRLQLLVLMLVLLGGLFPEKTSADEEASASPADEAEGAPVPTNATGSPNETAEGRADKDADIKCYSMQCEGNRSTCLKKLGIRIKCSGEHCFSNIFEYTDRDEVKVTRGCATKKQYDCLDKGCVFFDTKTAEEGDSKKFVDKSDCIKRAGRSGPGSGDEDMDSTSTISEAFDRMAEGRAEGSLKFKAAICACNRALCNDGRSSGPMGGKHLELGYSVALGGALLVSILPLRTMFLVG